MKRKNKKNYMVTYKENGMTYPSGERHPLKQMMNPCLTRKDALIRQNELKFRGKKSVKLIR